MTANARHHHDELRALGADTDVDGEYDVILELVGGENLATNLERLALQGADRGDRDRRRLARRDRVRLLMRKRGRIHGSMLRARSIAEKAEVMAALGAFMAGHPFQRAGRGDVPARTDAGRLRAVSRREQVRQDRRLSLTPRELNRATLARQLLLERADVGAVEAIRRLAGLQAQDSTGPYLGLWSRLRDFDRAELDRRREERRVVVATLQRVTMHMVTADDHRWLKPTLRPVSSS